MSLPTIFDTRDPYFSKRNDVLDRMFDLSFPWKIMKAFGVDPSTEQSLMPALDVTSDEKAYKIAVELPGVATENVKLEVKNGALVLSGEKKEETTDQKHVTERRWGSFTRSLTLPDDADVEQIKASHKNGVLTINIPKKEPKETTQKIAITTEA